MKYYIYERPHLKKFLEYCFKYTKSVSIWIARSKGWLDRILNVILKDYKNKFLFTISGRTTIKKFRTGLYYSHFYEHKIAKDLNITKDNTVIIDNTITTFECNYGNGIPIKSFDISDESKDIELLELCVFLENLIKENESIRKIEKIYWSIN